MSKILVKAAAIALGVALPIGLAIPASADATTPQSVKVQQFENAIQRAMALDRHAVAERLAGIEPATARQLANNGRQVQQKTAALTTALRQSGASGYDTQGLDLTVDQLIDEIVILVEDLLISLGIEVSVDIDVSIGVFLTEHLGLLDHLLGGILSFVDDLLVSIGIDITLTVDPTVEGLLDQIAVLVQDLLDALGIGVSPPPSIPELPATAR